jgi:hypothetical protein|tara:strand:- start:1701 stop:2264 length:564 start_codon:yes stop_codon:yes gene_type:complete
MIKQVNINEVLTNPNNPRTIKDDKFKKLVKSIKEFPQMLEKRAIVVDEAMMVLGGNMRLKACKDAGIKKVWVDVAEGWTEQQKKEFIVKDNVGFGEWDWDAIANEWEEDKLDDWGLDVWQPEEQVDYSALDDLDLEGALSGKEAGVKRGIQIEFDPEHYEEAFELINKARKEGKNVGFISLNAFRNA